MKQILIFIAMATICYNAAAQNKSFKTTELHYDACPSPAETMTFTWDESTGKVSKFYWGHGTETWFLYSYSPLDSKVVRDVNTLYDYDVYLWVTTAKYEKTAYQIRAKMTLSAVRPNGASFGGVYEGTGTTWIAAKGTYGK